MSRVSAPSATAEPSPPRPLLTPVGWVAAVAVAAGFICMFWEILRRSAMFSSDPDWSHIIIVPLISAYYVFQHKERLAAAPKRLCWPALPVLVGAIYLYLWWIYPGRNDMFRGYSAVLGLGALVWFVLGSRAMRVLWFPVLYLGFAVKISDAIWSRIAERLQDVAAKGATIVLEVYAAFTNVTVANDGNNITLRFFRDGAWVEEGLNVAEACAGLRMLMAFVALGVALAFLFDRPWWQRVVMMAVTVPVAVLVNIGRVAALGVIYTYNKEYAQGDFHVFVGLLMLIPAAGIFLLLGWIMDKIIIRDEDGGGGPPPVQAKPADAAIAGAGLDKPATAAVLVKGLLLGGVLALVTAGTYAMFFNSFSGAPLVESLTPGVSKALMAAGVVLGLGLFFLLPRLAPARRGAAGLTFGAAVAAGLLGVSAAGQHSVLAWQEAVLFKKEVPARHNLSRLPLELGPYRFVQDLPISSDEIEALGTEEFISRIYEDTSVKEREPGRLIRLHVTYYTGMVDTVPHVPDRCFTAAGIDSVVLDDQVVSLSPSVFTAADDGSGYVAESTLRAPVATADGERRRITVPQRDIATKRFTYRAKPTDPDQHVTYFFAANGKFLASPNAVRLQGFDIRDPYSYYAKVEVALIGVSDPVDVAEGTARFLDAYLPDIMACFPDWEQVRAGDWPVGEE